MVKKEKIFLAFGKAVKECRKSKGLSQEKLAFGAELDRTYISLLERGKRNPSLVTIYKIAKVLSIRPMELLKKL